VVIGGDDLGGKPVWKGGVPANRLPDRRSKDLIAGWAQPGRNGEL
jgi:hypothetical protein